MGSSIGARAYQITLRKKGDYSVLDFGGGGIVISPPKFVTDFVAQHTGVVKNAERERSWFFEEKVQGSPGNSKGYVNYGTFGFESNFVDSKTKKLNYKRKTTDTEEIPLFYDIWYPPNASYILCAFQSFQGRSCITLVMTTMQEEFQVKNPGYLLNFRKLLPTDSSGGLFNFEVQKLTLIKRDASPDLADKYFHARPAEPVMIEMSMTAKRRSSLGMLGTITHALRTRSPGLVTHDGIVFTDATAAIRVGGRTRQVGILGASGDAGVIDLTDAVTCAPNGHPTLDSISKEVRDILKDFHKTTSAAKL